MGDTADLAMVQKTIIDTLHNEGKSQRVITETDGCSRSAVSKHIKCKVEWKEEIGLEKVHKQQGWPQAWEYCQAKLIQTPGQRWKEYENILLKELDFYSGRDEKIAMALQELSLTLLG